MVNPNLTPTDIEEHKLLMEELLNSEYNRNAQVAVEYFLSFITVDEWKRRKKSVVSYFKEQQESMLYPDKFNYEINQPVAFYNDWTAWYLYLIESIHQRPYVNQPSQISRVQPFFAHFGKYFEKLKKIKDKTRHPRKVD